VIDKAGDEFICKANANTAARLCTQQSRTQEARVSALNNHAPHIYLCEMNPLPE
jgi:hypothetical protein